MVDEAADDEHDGREAEGGVAVSDAAVGAAAELPVVRPPRVRGFDDPAQPEREPVDFATRMLTEVANRSSAGGLADWAAAQASYGPEAN